MSQIRYVGPEEETKAYGQTWKKGEWAELEDERLAAKAKATGLFEIKEPTSAASAPTHIPPSQQSAQGPVPKGGEPIHPVGLGPIPPVKKV